MLKVAVTNHLDRTVGRGNRVFPADAEYPMTVEVDANRLAEITGCKHLSAVVVGAAGVDGLPPPPPVGGAAPPDAGSDESSDGGETGA